MKHAFSNCVESVLLRLKSRNLRYLAVLCVLLGAFGTQALAQEATIVGTVLDPTGAAVPGATITLTNAETGLVRQLTTNEVGQYVAPDLRIGHYTVRAEKAGFKVAERKDILLQVGDRVRLDFSLEIGSTTETITVEAAPIAVQTDTGDISDVITSQQVTQIALNGRTIYNLVAVLPGVSSNMPDSQMPTPVGGNAELSFNGQRMVHNIWLIDGGENLDRGGGGTLSVMPSVDAIAEFRALSSNYSAEYGLSSAGTMTMVLKSGMDKYHATAWEFNRNDAYNAKNFFLGPTAKKSKLRFNVFGFNVGGPVPFEGLSGPHKTFFFYNMEWRRQISGGAFHQLVPDQSWYGGVFPTSIPITVPTAAMLSTAEQTRLTNAGLTLGAPFPNNTIPTSVLNANAQALLTGAPNAYGSGIFPNVTSPGGYFDGTADAPTNVREEIVRIDHRFTDKFSIFGHWISDHILQTFIPTMWAGSGVPSVGNTFGNPSYSAVVHAIHTISPTLVNEIAFNYNGNRILIDPIGLLSKTDVTGLNLPEIFSNNNLNRIPNVNISNYVNFQEASWPWHNAADDYQIRDDISWTKAAHQFKFGASWAFYKKKQDLFGQSQGNFNFNGSFTGNAFADFLLGYSNSYQELGIQDFGLWNNVSWAAYAEDSWRVNRRLTLNLGLRWDGVPHTYEAKNRHSNFYPELYSSALAAVMLANGNIDPVATPAAAFSTNSAMPGVLMYTNGIGIQGQSGVPKGLVDNYWDAFGPRVGFAYDLVGDGKTVLRGGFGVMFERIQGNDMYNGGPNVPFSAAISLDNVSLTDPHTTVAPPGGTASAPTVAPGIVGLDRAYKLPTSYQYSVSVQRGLGANTVLSVAYVGNANRHLSLWNDVNVPDASTLPTYVAGTAPYSTVTRYRGFGELRMAQNVGNSHYNSLQASLRGQIKSDLTLQVAYTFAKGYDTSTNRDGNGWDLNRISNPYDRNYDYGPSVLDRRHNLVANFVYKIPLLKNSPSRALKSVAGGWEVSGVITAQTGIPINVIIGGGSQSNNRLPSAQNRPNLTGDITYTKTIAQWFTGNFSSPAVGSWGNTPHNAVYGPGRFNWNMSLFKGFLFSETRGSKLEIRVEAFNLFNHPQWRGVNNNFSSSAFGQVNSTWDPRTLQLGAKLYF